MKLGNILGTIGFGFGLVALIIACDEKTNNTALLKKIDATANDMTSITSDAIKNAVVEKAVKESAAAAVAREIHCVEDNITVEMHCQLTNAVRNKIDEESSNMSEKIMDMIDSTDCKNILKKVESRATDRLVSKLEKKLEQLADDIWDDQSGKRVIIYKR